MYGLDIDKKLTLSSLLTKIIGVLNNVRWLRLLYLYPENLTPDLIRLIAEEPRICKYVDLPLQHINRRVLKAMKRPYDKKKILRMLSVLRGKIPTAAIRTSLIVGFPGETDKEFKELVSFVKEQRFQRLGVFRYTLEVLIDEKESEGNYIGRLSIDAPEVDQAVSVKSGNPLSIGSFVKAKIIDTSEYDLAAEAV